MVVRGKGRGGRQGGCRVFAEAWRRAGMVVWAASHAGKRAGTRVSVSDALLLPRRGWARPLLPRKRQAQFRLRAWPAWVAWGGLCQARLGPG